MERVQELQAMMWKVEPPQRLMGGFSKWLQERQAADNVNGTTGYGGKKIDFKDPEVQAAILEELSKQGPSADEVYPGLFVGNGKSAKDVQYLKSLNISHVVNMAEGDRIMPIVVDLEEFKKNDISYYGALCNDEDGDDISKFFVPTANFIDDAFAAGGRVLVNCVGGMSRSSTIAVSFLIQKRGLALEEALSSLRQKRDISPNNGFLLSLVKLENSINV